MKRLRKNQTTPVKETEEVSQKKGLPTVTGKKPKTQTPKYFHHTQKDETAAIENEHLSSKQQNLEE